MRTEDNNQAAETWLDAAMKQYGEAEPRPGLENRVLANLHAEQSRLSSRPWWWRPLAAFAMVAILGAGTLFVRRKPDVPATPIATQPSVATGDTQTELPVASSIRRHAVLKSPFRARVSKHISHLSSVPRLEQFPAPAPLSEQEEMLARYVREHRQEATMVAKARAELLKTELLRFRLPPASPANLDDFEQ
jgi:hypothetical protein